MFDQLRQRVAAGFLDGKQPIQARAFAGYTGLPHGGNSKIIRTKCLAEPLMAAHQGFDAYTGKNIGCTVQ
jgi:hypothetical protein